jgi:glycosyltransferase involved in cell wall biosynthesis
MRLSVIVTTYNRPEALEPVIQGLGRQNPAPDEVIVADDGSGPRTARLIETLAARLTVRLDHVWHPDQGFRAAAIRNAAIRRARGDYLVFLDGDCIPGRHFIADHRRLAEKGCFFQGGRVLVSRRLSAGFDLPRSRNRGRIWRDLIRGDLGNAHHLLRLPAWPARRSRRLAGIRSCNMGIWRADLAAVNGFNEDFVGWGREDSELAVRLFRFGLCCKRHPFMAACFHLWHPQHPRDRLALNDALLQAAMERPGHSCRNGIEKRCPPLPVSPR